MKNMCGFCFFNYRACQSGQREKYCLPDIHGETRGSQSERKACHFTSCSWTNRNRKLQVKKHDRPWFLNDLPCLHSRGRSYIELHQVVQKKKNYASNADVCQKLHTLSPDVEKRTWCDSDSAPSEILVDGAVDRFWHQCSLFREARLIARFPKDQTTLDSKNGGLEVECRHFWPPSTDHQKTRHFRSVEI